MSPLEPAPSVSEKFDTFKAGNSFSSGPSYSVEFFHIYTDEAITAAHEASLNYLREAKKAWNLNAKPIVLIDDYNPTDHVLSTEDVLMHLERSGVPTIYWAYEGDMVENAKILL